MSYRDLFESLNEAGLTYVVLRRYDDLPRNTVSDEGDVDVLLDRSQFKDGIAVCESIGFSSMENQPSSRIKLFYKALWDPEKAIQALKSNPTKPIGRLVTGGRTGGADLENPRHKNKLLHRDEQVLDLQNNLAYKSPRGGVRVPVHPSVTEGMLKRRQKNDCFYVPAPSDELAHLITHCVFNKDGKFPPYYEDRCGKLFQRIESNEDQLQLLDELLEKIYFKAGDLVLTLTKEGRYSDIHSELRRFSCY